LFEIQIGEWCDTGACYISVPEEKTMLEWTCKNKKTHKTKFPQTFIAAPINLKDQAAGMDDFKNL
jgi:hypothetical protein